MLIIYAHPSHRGHNAYMLETLENQLCIENRFYNVIDLYKDDFDPNLSKKELYTQGGKNTSPQIKDYQEQLLKHDEIVLFFPCWWGGVPAILKGFFDRVLTPGFAYKFEDSKLLGLLNNKKAHIVMTTGSPENDFYSTVTTVMSANLKICGIKSQVHTIYNCRKLNDEKKIELEDIVNTII
jgi:NAD(P)H dehydrogenase (quinone)